MCYKLRKHEDSIGEIKTREVGFKFSLSYDKIYLTVL